MSETRVRVALTITLDQEEPEGFGWAGAIHDGLADAGLLVSGVQIEPLVEGEAPTLKVWREQEGPFRLWRVKLPEEDVALATRSEETAVIEAAQGFLDLDGEGEISFANPRQKVKVNP